MTGEYLPKTDDSPGPRRLGASADTPQGVHMGGSECRSNPYGETQGQGWPLPGREGLLLLGSIHL